jgi:uncharacterized protein YndB with AHSA1/START domain
MTDPHKTDVAEVDVFISRAFAAPRERLLRLWKQPEQLASWFGPTGYSVPEGSINLQWQVGGRWDLTMVENATGSQFPVRAKIEELDEPELVVMTMSADTGLTPLRDVMLRVQFHDHGDRTRITLHQGPFNARMGEDTASGWQMSFDKIDAILEAEQE